MILSGLHHSQMSGYENSISRTTVAVAHTPPNKPAESPAVFTFIEERAGDIDASIAPGSPRSGAAVVRLLLPGGEIQALPAHEVPNTVKELNDAGHVVEIKQSSEAGAMDFPDARKAAAQERLRLKREKASRRRAREAMNSEKDLEFQRSVEARKREIQLQKRFQQSNLLEDEFNSTGAEGEVSLSAVSSPNLFNHRSKIDFDDRNAIDYFFENDIDGEGFCWAQHCICIAKLARELHEEKLCQDMLHRQGFEKIIGLLLVVPVQYQSIDKPCLRCLDHMAKLLQGTHQIGNRVCDENPFPIIIAVLDRQKDDRDLNKIRRMAFFIMDVLLDMLYHVEHLGGEPKTVHRILEFLNNGTEKVITTILSVLKKICMQELAVDAMMRAELPWHWLLSQSLPVRNATLDLLEALCLNTPILDHTQICTAFTKIFQLEAFKGEKGQRKCLSWILSYARQCFDAESLLEQLIMGHNQTLGTMLRAVGEYDIKEILNILYVLFEKVADKSPSFLTLLLDTGIIVRVVERIQTMGNLAALLTLVSLPMGVPLEIRNPILGRHFHFLNQVVARTFEHPQCFLHTFLLLEPLVHVKEDGIYPYHEGVVKTKILGAAYILYCEEESHRPERMKTSQVETIKTFLLLVRWLCFSHSDMVRLAILETEDAIQKLVTKILIAQSLQKKDEAVGQLAKIIPRLLSKIKTQPKPRVSLLHAHVDQGTLLARHLEKSPLTLTYEQMSQQGILVEFIGENVENARFMFSIRLPGRVTMTVALSWSVEVYNIDLKRFGYKDRQIYKEREVCLRLDLLHEALMSMDAGRPRQFEEPSGIALAAEEDPAEGEDQHIDFDWRIDFSGCNMDGTNLHVLPHEFLKAARRKSGEVFLWSDVASHSAVPVDVHEVFEEFMLISSPSDLNQLVKRYKSLPSKLLDLLMKKRVEALEMQQILLQSTRINAKKVQTKTAHSFTERRALFDSTMEFKRASIHWMSHLTDPQGKKRVKNMTAHDINSKIEAFENISDSFMESILENKMEILRKWQFRRPDSRFFPHWSATGFHITVIGGDDMARNSVFDFLRNQLHPFGNVDMRDAVSVMVTPGMGLHNCTLKPYDPESFIRESSLPWFDLVIMCMPSEPSNLDARLYKSLNDLGSSICVARINVDQEVSVLRNYLRSDSPESLKSYEQQKLMKIKLSTCAKLHCEDNVFLLPSEDGMELVHCILIRFVRAVCQTVNHADCMEIALQSKESLLRLDFCELQIKRIREYASIVNQNRMLLEFLNQKEVTANWEDEIIAFYEAKRKSLIPKSNGKRDISSKKREASLLQDPLDYATYDPFDLEDKKLQQMKDRVAEELQPPFREDAFEKLQAICDEYRSLTNLSAEMQNFFNQKELEIQVYMDRKDLLRKKVTEAQIQDSDVHDDMFDKEMDLLRDRMEAKVLDQLLANCEEIERSSLEKKDNKLGWVLKADVDLKRAVIWHANLASDENKAEEAWAINETELNGIIRKIPHDVLSSICERDRDLLVKSFLCKPPEKLNFDGGASHSHIAVIGAESKDLISSIDSATNLEGATLWNLPNVEIPLHQYIRMNHVLWYSLVILIGAVEDSIELAAFLAKRDVQCIFLQTGIEEEVWEILKRERRRNPNLFVSHNFWQRQIHIAEAKWRGRLSTPIYFVNLNNLRTLHFPFFTRVLDRFVSHGSLLSTPPVLFVQTLIQKWLAFHIRHMGKSYDQIAASLLRSCTDFYDLLNLSSENMSEIGLLPLQRSKFRQIIKALTPTDEEEDAFPLAHSWNAETVRDYLLDLGFDKIAQNMFDFGIGGDLMIEMSEDDWLEHFKSNDIIIEGIQRNNFFRKLGRLKDQCKRAAQKPVRESGVQELREKVLREESLDGNLIFACVLNYEYEETGADGVVPLSEPKQEREMLQSLSAKLRCTSEEGSFLCVENYKARDLRKLEKLLSQVAELNPVSKLIFYFSGHAYLYDHLDCSQLIGTDGEMYCIDSLSRECKSWVKTFIIDGPLLPISHCVSPRRRAEGPIRWIFGMREHGACLAELHRRFGRPPIRFDVEVVDAVKLVTGGVVSFTDSFPRAKAAPSALSKELLNHSNLLLEGSEIVWNHMHLLIEQLVRDDPIVLYTASTADGLRHILSIDELKNGKKKIHRISDVKYIASCGCGSIRASIFGEPQILLKCHCNLCRSYSGMGPTVWGMFDVDNVHFQIKGKTTQENNRTFCADCQELVFMLYSGSANPYINLQTLMGMPFSDDVLQEISDREKLVVAHQHVSCAPEDPNYRKHYLQPRLPIHEGAITDAGGEEIQDEKEIKDVI